MARFVSQTVSYLGVLTCGFLSCLDSSKEYQLGDKLFMTAIGEAGDADNFSDWAKRNIYLYKLRHNYELSPRSAHHWLRKSIAHNLRTEDFWRVDLLLGGYDDNEKKAFLGSVDYLGTGVPDQASLDPIHRHLTLCFRNICSVDLEVDSLMPFSTLYTIQVICLVVL